MSEPNPHGQRMVVMAAGERFDVRRNGDRWEARSHQSLTGEWASARSVAFALIKARVYKMNPAMFGIEARDAEIRVLRGS